jgi:hypothetical protein
MKALRKPNLKQTATVADETTDEIKLPAATESTVAAEPEKKRRTARFAKGSAEAKEHMDKLRAMRKKPTNTH